MSPYFGLVVAQGLDLLVPPPQPRRRDPNPSQGDQTGQWLVAVADAAAAASHAPVGLLGDYLTMLADAALSGRRPGQDQLTTVRELGRRAAEQGVGAGQAVELYLSAAWRLWRELPLAEPSRNREEVRAAAEAVLRVLDDSVAVLVDGYQAERREMIRQEASLRREVIDDLLRGDADVSRMIQRAEPFGIDFGRAHLVALAAAPAAGSGELERAAAVLERVVVDKLGDRDVLVTTKDGRVVVLVPEPNAASGSLRDSDDVVRLIQVELSRPGRGRVWRVTAGRAFLGAYGIARSYEEAREAITLAERLKLGSDAMHARDLLLYRVIARDQEALVDLVRTVLEPLAAARGGAEPLLQTMQTYFETGAVATETASRLNMSVRTVTYRLAKVKTLTGHDPGDPAQRLALHTAVMGARLLDWPVQDLKAFN